jgi:hypothetical protein
VIASKTGNLYDQVVSVTREYFGPAANRFINRQITNHLHIEPQELKSRDLDKLIDWIKLAMALLSEDELIINKYTLDLKLLAKSPK